MGRVIRRVIPGWEHPKRVYDDGVERFIPMLDDDFETAASVWISEFEAWREGKYSLSDEKLFFWEEVAPPNREEYRPIQWSEEDATAYQIYEDVTEGTPVSPVFLLQQEMREWLLQEGYSEYAVDRFIEHGWAPSATVGRDGVWHWNIHSWEIG